MQRSVQLFLGSDEELCPVHVQSKSTLNKATDIIRDPRFVHDGDDLELHALGRHKHNGFRVLLA